jgi:hypothetical protein
LDIAILHNIPIHPPADTPFGDDAARPNFALHKDGQAIEWLRRSVALDMQFSNAQATLAAALALSGHETESRDILKRYLLLSTTKARTISQWKIARISDNPAWLAYRERLYEYSGDAGGMSASPLLYEQFHLPCQRN